MSFEVREHALPAQHIRELPDALAVDEAHPDTAIHLHIKQYIPKNNPHPQPGDVTIIAFQGNGFCKEMYEPIWEHLLTSLPPNKRIRSIWIADMAHQASSYLLNESKLGLGISWNDHARDVLHMVNYFRSEMPPPLMGVGHSMGSVVLLKLATIHPRLFHSVTLLDTWLWSAQNTNPVPTSKTLKPVVFRKDVFASAQIAHKALRKNPFFKSWDPQCLQIYLDHLLRPMPTLLHPGEDDSSSKADPATIKKFALRTPKQMEAATLTRPNPYSYNTHSQSSRLERLVMPYMHYGSPLKAPTSNPSTKTAITDLSTLRPRCLFLYGTTSHVNGRDARKDVDIDRQRNLEITGRESGGSGGAALGCVSEDWIEGTHCFPFESPAELGARLARWADEESIVWSQERKEVQDLLWKGRDCARTRQELDPEFTRIIKDWDGSGWHEPEGEDTVEGAVRKRVVEESDGQMKAKL